MSYTALYRKFRPDTFDEVKGQDQVAVTLKNQVRSGRFQHAYLFCGTRGTGKTSSAKIFAKAVNCENPTDGNPCGECASCKAIAAGRSMNVIEIDAASNNGVDNIREIIEEVQYAPDQGKFKVYIIDEVHMLSPGAFNALLKTLEEPPEYVIFILATTEVGKIPVTILSRCQRYDFRRIDVDTITDRLRELAQREGIDAEEKALRFVARSADGAMRDALSLLDRCVSFYFGETLTYDKALKALGEADSEVFGEMTRMCSHGNAGGMIRRLGKEIANGVEIGQFITDYIWYLRNLLIVKTSSREDAEEIIDVTSEQMLEYEELAAETEADSLMRAIRILSELLNRMRYASNRRVLAETTMIQLARPDGDRREDALIGRIRLLEEKLEELEINGFAEAQPVYVKREEAPAQKEDRYELPEGAPDDLRLVCREWKKLVAEMPDEISFLRNCLKNGASVQFNEQTLENRLYIEMSENGRITDDVVKEDRWRECLERYLEKKLGVHINVEIHARAQRIAGLKTVNLDSLIENYVHAPIEFEDDEDDREEFL